MSINTFKSTCKTLSQLAADPDKKPAVIRLALAALTLVAGLLISLFALPPITDGFGQFLEATFTGIVVSIMCAALMWGFAKWTGFIFPKAYALASGFWNSLYALGIFALAIKVMIWIYLLVMPMMLYGIVLAPLMLLVSALSKIGIPLLGELIMTLLIVGALFFMVVLDVCKLRDLSWKQTLQDMFARVRLSCSCGWQKLMALGRR